MNILINTFYECLHIHKNICNLLHFYLITLWNKPCFNTSFVAAGFPSRRRHGQGHVPQQPARERRSSADRSLQHAARSGRHVGWRRRRVRQLRAAVSTSAQPHQPDDRNERDPPGREGPAQRHQVRVAAGGASRRPDVVVRLHGDDAWRHVRYHVSSSKFVALHSRS